MNVLHIITGLNNGGAEAVLYRLVTADKNNTHQIISLMDFGVYGKRLTAARIPVYSLNMPRGRVTIKGLVGLYRLICQIKPEVIQTWMYHADLIGGLVARFAGARTVVWGIRHSNLDAKKNSLSTRMVAHLCAAISRLIPTKIVSCSVVATKVHASLGYPLKKINVIPNGYDIDQLSPSVEARKRLRSELGVEECEILLGMVARWDPQKDHTNLVSALALLDEMRCPPWRCLLVGPGMQTANDPLNKLLMQYGMVNRVMLLGPRSDIPDIMNSLDLHVLSSYGEAFPNVVAEAMACGVPAVVTDVGDAALIVGKVGWVVPPSDSHALAAAIVEAVQAMTNRESWKHRQDDCRGRVVESFNLNSMVSAYLSVWQQALDENSASGH